LLISYLQIDIIWIEYIEKTIMNWSDEYKLCYIGHCRQNISLWDR
jgi:hypothetical protein